MKCRHCKADINHLLIDLGESPPSNAYQKPNASSRPPQYPLRVFTCTHCWLVQTEDFVAPDALFTPDYAYFSSHSKTWLAHAESFARQQLSSLPDNAFVIEVASNDGYLLKHFAQADVRCLGVEPAAAVAGAARQLGIQVHEAFLSESEAKEIVQVHGPADLVVANNVLAHVPNLVDFVRGLTTLLAPEGRLSVEFPHLLNLIEENQFDTIYHEHFSYFSVKAVAGIFEVAGLGITEIEKLPTHGGSLRVTAQRGMAHSAIVEQAITQEEAAGLFNLQRLEQFKNHAQRAKNDLVSYLRNCGGRIAAYGAAAKGNTFLNYADLTVKDIVEVADAAPSKQGLVMPGSEIPIVTPDEMLANRPDVIVILPWNLADEIAEQLAEARTWGAKFVTAIPELRVF